MLKAGFSRMDVTPPLGSFIAGDFKAIYSENIHDPIYLNTLALELNGEKVILIACDFLMIEMSYADKIRALISERTGVPVNNIILHALHQHTSIVLCSRQERKHNNVDDDVAYLNVLYRKFGDAAIIALKDLKEARLSTGEMDTDEQIAFIRRWIMKDGSVLTNPGGKHLEVDREYYDADNTVRLLKFEREGAKDIALVNFSTHACVIWMYSLINSAEWPGFARTYIEHDIDDVNCIFTTGFEGDSNHCNFKLPEYPTGLEHSKHMGRVIADTVIKMWNSTEYTAPDSLFVENDIIYNKTRTDGEENYDEAVKIYNDFHSGKIKNLDYTIVGNVSRIKRLKNEPIYQKIPATVINLGKIGFAGLGGEPFTRYAVETRKRCSNRFIITLCCTNGGQGYLPIKEAFDEGGYEAGCSSFNPDIEEQCVSKLVELLNKKSKAIGG